MNKTTRLNISIREKLHEIIFEADTKTGKLFDIISNCKHNY